MSTQPKSKIVSLIQELNEIRREGSADPFTLRRIEKEAGTLKSDPVEYHQVLGVVAAVEGKLGKMRNHFKIAQELAPNDLDLRQNFASSLRHFGFFLEAREVYNNLHGQLRGNLQFLEIYVMMFYVTGRFNSALRAIQELKALLPGRAISNEISFLKFASFIENSEIAEDDVEEMEQVVEQFLQEKKIYGWLLEYELLSDEETTTLVGDVLLRNTIEETVKLRMELGRRMAELQLPEKVFNSIHFHLKSRETLEDGDYADRAVHLL